MTKVMTNMLPSEIIDTMLTEVIPDESRWGQGSRRDVSSDGDEKYCMLGALGMAAYGEAYSTLRAYDSHRAAYSAICGQIHQLPGCQLDSIITFNDADGRTYDEVREMLEKTRAGLQEQGQ